MWKRVSPVNVENVCLTSEFYEKLLLNGLHKWQNISKINMRSRYLKYYNIDIYKKKYICVYCKTHGLYPFAAIGTA
jgi:hypothetical protein